MLYSKFNHTGSSYIMKESHTNFVILYLYCNIICKQVDSLPSINHLLIHLAYRPAQALSDVRQAEKEASVKADCCTVGYGTHMNC